MANPTPQQQTIYQAAWRVAAIAAAFCVVVAALLVYDYSLRGAKNPSEEISFTTLALLQAQNPQDESLKAHARELDRALIREYFRHKAFRAVGAGVLAAGLIVFVIAAKTAEGARRKLPDPGAWTAPRDEDAEMALAARWGLVGLSAVLVCGALALAISIRLPWGDRPDPAAMLAAQSSAETKSASGAGEMADNPSVVQPTDPGTFTIAASALPPPASAEELAKGWPRFRGPEGLGISAYTNVPETWNGASGENVVWKSAVPLPGNNSPIVFGNRLFVCGADETRREVYCFDTESGKLLWQREAPGTPESTAEPPAVMEDTGFAACTMATDGRLAFAIFANGDLAAFDYEGRSAWSKSFGVPVNSYGHASSLALHNDCLFVQLDQGSAGEALSKLYALDTATGNVAWTVDREVPNSWTSPIVVRTGEAHQLITAADPWAIAYNPLDGKELWRAKCLRQDVGPSPAYADGVAYVANEYPALSGIRVDGQGDVTETHVLFKQDEAVLPDTSSPLATGEYIFLLASSGIMSCCDAKKGELLWELEFEAEFSSSPSLVGKKVYVVGREGMGWVVEPSPEEGKIVAESDLGEECVTSPAFQNGRIYLRGEEHVFCLGTK